MDHSRSSSPEQNLWSSILDSVSSKRSLPSGNVLILGEPSSGKSTLANALLQKTATAVHHADGEWSGKTDFALGYEWANVKEEGEEDIVARLSVYSVPSSAPAHLSLIPYFLPPRTSLPHTLIMIVLDWTKPWSFLEQLHTWLAWSESWVNSDKSRDTQVLREEGRDRLQSHLQHYTEPSAAPGSADSLPTVASSLNSTLLPLGQGTFSHNSAGVPIIVTCTKADLIDDEIDPGIGMAKGKGGEWEERTDAVMQVLRTICLKYGAALFYTTPQPATLSYLRQYVLHFLFMPPPPPPDFTPLKYPFPFTHRPNILDRDRIMVPAGWDSWSKIAILRDGFEASRWAEAWEKDIENKNAPAGGARDLFRSLVGHQQGPKVFFFLKLFTSLPV
ncbi:hypothetical protein BS47DRAFT_608424 [Hydnum rufescens UP504]|uniref:DLIC-domain-containing protein n=1 Tax=Hydnum rufescens UP504 TaxID=1448309 RepID=A0A9P6B368_9AGAM|nr:hypothetical protein BS47DRAFT_608424 [Hydnum rufescens UP504]